MQENKGNKGDLYVYSLTHSKIATTIPIGYGDLEILQMYKHVLKKPMLAVLHYMIGTAAKCWEEHHNRNIKEMEEKLRTNEEIIVAYLQKFGRIRPH